MNFTAIFCCYVLLPYFASLVSPPQKAITCYAGKVSSGRKMVFVRKTGCKVKSNMKKLLHGRSKPSTEKLPVDETLIIPKVPLEDKYFKQKCDHYHFKNANKWPQRYLIYDDHYDGNGIIFIWIGRDEDITTWNMQNGIWYDYCKAAKALCIGIELRGYGKSLPNGSLVEENLRYLNSEQALADVAWFIYSFNDLMAGHKLPKKLKWIAYGKSEEGALAAWLRMKFPHLVHAALSLSALVLAKEDYNEYFKIIDVEMLNNEPEFKGEIQKVYKKFHDDLTNKKFREILELFNFCDEYSLDDQAFKGKHMDFIYFTFAQIVATIVQNGNDDMAFMKKEATNIMPRSKNRNKKLKSPINRFSLLIKQMLQNYNKKCLQMNYFTAINRYKITTDSGYDYLDYPLSEILGNRTNLYQNCNEFGRFETFENFFGTSIGLRFYTDFCNGVFGIRYYPKEQLKKGVRRTNVFYGGFSIVVSRVIFVYGSNDLYRNLGLIDYHPANCMIYVLKGARICNELDYYKSIKQAEHDINHDIYIQLIDWLNLFENNEDDENTVPVY